MLTKGGVKLLDFGLAKLKPPAVDSASSAVATRNQPLTREGAILGTLHYMAPEQLEGKEADARSDIFALGCVLYEMLTGRQAFEGETPASVITAVMSKTPAPMAELAPPSVERLVSECLTKDPDARWQSASDLGRTLAWILEPVREPVRPRGRPVPAILGALLVLAVGTIVVLLLRPEPEMPLVRFPVYPPEDTKFRSRDLRTGVSPDGKLLAFIIYRIYEIDPLTCSRCWAKMKILAFHRPRNHLSNPRHLDQNARPRAPPHRSR
jgi:eukaryotic-like serine/threonine-protein kinase